ncbi:MAG: LPXTG cell wall anchor domain-containing protein [Thiogranum sp.]|nr:LPXTG cell wall anchor domain-containing protein [Thiogranum sp.]
MILDIATLAGAIAVLLILGALISVRRRRH